MYRSNLLRNLGKLLIAFCVFLFLVHLITRRFINDTSTVLEKEPPPLTRFLGLGTGIHRLNESWAANYLVGILRYWIMPICLCILNLIVDRHMQM